MTTPTAHVDRFAQAGLPPREQWPELIFELPELQFPARLNAAAALLDARVAAGDGDRPCIHGETETWSYARLQAEANRIARVLVEDLGLVPGNRVLLRAPNNAMLAACWFAVIKAGGICVATMPLLRAKELGQIVAKAEISHALCDARLVDELELARAQGPTLREVCCWGGDAADRLEARAAAKPADFATLDTAAEDCALIAFTSGTTGQPKGTLHNHRDLLAICRCWPVHCLKPTRDDVFIGSPPLAFTFGLGGLLLFPMSVGASTVLLEKTAPEVLLPAIARHRATVLFTAPTSYRAMAPLLADQPVPGLRKCVSAGEALPAATRALWKRASGLELIDGIGATEMLHIFISHDEATARPGATGRPVPGYRACVLGDDGRVLPPGEVGRLAVKGPTGCRYLNDARQAQYVVNGWNLTGDAYRVDTDGYFI